MVGCPDLPWKDGLAAGGWHTKVFSDVLSSYILYMVALSLVIETIATEWNLSANDSFSDAIIAHEYKMVIQRAVERY